MTASTRPLTWTKLVTSCSTNTKPFSPKRWEMLSIDPVSRLSMATTSSPRASSASQRCEPRKPAPPVTTTRATLRSAPPDAVVREAAPADCGRIEQVPGVDDAALGHQAADLVEVEPPELVPLGQHQEDGRVLAGRVRIGRHLEAVDLAGHGRVVGADARPPRLEAFEDLERGRAPEVVGAGLERQAPRRHQLVLHRAAGHALDLGDHTVELLVVDLDHASQQPEVVAGVLGDPDE